MITQTSDGRFTSRPAICEVISLTLSAYLSAYAAEISLLATASAASLPPSRSRYGGTAPQTLSSSSRLARPTLRISLHAMANAREKSSPAVLTLFHALVLSRIRRANNRSASVLARFALNRYVSAASSHAISPSSETGNFLNDSFVSPRADRAARSRNSLSRSRFDSSAMLYSRLSRMAPCALPANAYRSSALMFPISDARVARKRLRMLIHRSEARAMRVRIRSADQPIHCSRTRLCNVAFASDPIAITGRLGRAAFLIRNSKDLPGVGRYSIDQV